MSPLWLLLFVVFDVAVVHRRVVGVVGVMISVWCGVGVVVCDVVGVVVVIVDC